MNCLRSILLTLAMSTVPFLGYAYNNLETQRQVGTIPALIVIGLLVLIQLLAYANAFIYYFKGELKALIMSLIPTIITFIITLGLISLQLFRSVSDLRPYLLFALFLCFIFSVLGLGWRKHSITFIHPDRFNDPPPLEKFLKQKTRFYPENTNNKK
jgi:hypothetical protein